MTSIRNAYTRSLHQPSPSARTNMVLEAIRREVAQAEHIAQSSSGTPLALVELLAEIGEDLVIAQGSTPGMTTINGQDGVTIATQFKITDPNPDDAGIDAIEAARDNKLGD